MKVGRLHVVTDEVMQDRWSHVDLAQAACKGGADVVQFREKRLWTTASLLAVARAMRKILKGSATLLIVNDRLDVARACQAAGAHGGWDDLPVPSARALLGSKAILGGTANSLEEAQMLDGMAVDYIGAGPVFGTQTKAQPAAALGLEGLAQIVAGVRHKPVIAIGNITAAVVPDVLATGAYGVAVSRTVVMAEDPCAAICQLRTVLDQALRRTG